MEKSHLLEQKWANQFDTTSVISFRIGVNALFGRIAPRPPPVVCATGSLRDWTRR